MFPQVLPRHIQALNGLASLYGHLKRWEEAEALFLRLIEISPQYVEAHFNLGTLYAHMGSWVSAPLPPLDSGR